MDKLSCSVGLFAHNEEANIGFCISAILAQRLDRVRIVEIAVVASGCTDRTTEIAASFQDRDPRVRLLIQERREGKASAVNLFLEHTGAPICIIESADTILDPEAIEHLVLPFADPAVGMTGARPVPLNEPRGFTGRLVNFNWALTHALSLRSPRLGECVAYRRIFDSIAPDTAVEEAYVEALIRRAGHEIRYVPKAIVRNRAPESVRTYLLQSRRYTTGHLDLKHRLGYSVSSMKPGRIVRTALEGLRGSPVDLPWKIGAILVEAWGRVLGAWDYFVKRKNPFIWDVAGDTKVLRTPNVYLKEIRPENRDSLRKGIHRDEELP